MNKNLKSGHKSSILIKVFSVIMALTVSTILFILAIWGILDNKSDQLYAHVHLAITLVILVIVGSLVASFVIRKILKPLLILNNAVEEIGKGNLDQKIEVKSNDELGSLADGFNKMTSDIKKMIQARDQLLLNVSHELRTPITRSRLALEMLPDSIEKESISGDLKDMENMVTGILDSEQLRNGMRALKLSNVNIGGMIREVLCNYRAESSRIILFPVSEGLIIIVDENLIKIVLRNIIDNALKYSFPENKPIEISVIHSDEAVSIQIEDFGQGIPEEMLPFVFEPFYRVDQSRSKKTGGYGLGLHLCKQIMDMHEADIEIRNKPDKQGIILSLCFRT